MTELSVHFSPDMPAAAVEILSADQRPLERLWLGPDETQTVEVPSLDAVVQVFLPSGETVTLAEPGAARREISQAALADRSPERRATPVRVVPPPGETRDPTPLRSRSVRGAGSGQQDTLPRGPLGPYYATLSDGAARGREVVGDGAERGLVFEPASTREEAHELVVQTVGSSDPRLTVRLPGTLASVHVTRVDEGDQHRLRVRARTWNTASDTLGAYLARGDLRAASGMTAWAERAHDMLQNKVRDPSAATVGAYLLLRLRRFDLLRDWARNLATWFPSLADGCVVWAWQCIHQGRDPEEAAEYLTMAAERPLPVYTTGLRLLLDGLQLMGEAGEAPLRTVREAAGFVLWDSPFTATLSGGVSRLGPDLLTDVGYATDRVVVDSSALASMGYRDRTLTVEFGDGLTYAHAGVPREVYEDMLRAETKGGFYNQYVRGTYPGRRLS